MLTTSYNKRTRVLECRANVGFSDTSPSRAKFAPHAEAAKLPPDHKQRLQLNGPVIPISKLYDPMAAFGAPEERSTREFSMSSKFGVTVCFCGPIVVQGLLQEMLYLLLVEMPSPAFTMAAAADGGSHSCDKQVARCFKSFRKVIAGRTALLHSATIACTMWTTSGLR